MITIIDYGMGNLRSVQKAFEKLGHEAMVTDAAGSILAVESFGIAATTEQDARDPQ